MNKDCIYYKECDEREYLMAEIKGSTIAIKIILGISLWDAIKLRISGIYKNIEKIKSIGDVSIITFRNKI